MNNQLSTQERNTELGTTYDHRLMALIATTFLVFECLFLFLYSNDCWFFADISSLGIPALLLCAFFAHLLLFALQSKKACSLFAPIWKGSPPIIYWHSVKLEAAGISFGTRFIQWSAIDSLSLTRFGNLLVKSRAICGEIAREPDLILKLPASAMSNQSLLRLVSALRSHKPIVSLDRSLQKQLRSRDLKGAVKIFGSSFLCLILLDLGQSTFSFLQMSKEYYLAKAAATEGDAAAASHLANADYIYHHPLIISWVSPKLRGFNAAGSGNHLIRSQALWLMNRQTEALAEARKAIACTPNNFRLYLYLARLLAQQGKWAESMAQISLAEKHHKNSLLPNLYMLSELSVMHKKFMAKYAQLYLASLDDQVFDDQLAWPPGSEAFMHEIFYRQDIQFIFNQLLGLSGGSNRRE